MQGWRRELLHVSERIAVLCCEKTRIQGELRTMCSDSDRAVDARRSLVEIEDRRDSLLHERRKLLQLGRFTV